MKNLHTTFHNKAITVKVQEPRQHMSPLSHNVKGWDNINRFISSHNKEMVNENEGFQAVKINFQY